MGAAFDLNTPPPAPAAPEPTPAPASPPEGSPSPGAPEGTSGQPTTTPSAPAAAAPAPAPPPEPEAHVPYPRFRQVQREYTQFRREAEPKLERYESQIRQLEEREKAWSQRSTDFDALETLLRTNPDLAEALLERARTGGSPAARTAAPASTSSPQPAALPATVLSRLERMDRMAQAWEASQGQAAAAREEQETQQLHHQVDTELKKFLVGKNLSEALLPIAKAYIVQAATTGPFEGATVDELPYLIGDWYRRMQQSFQGQLRGVVDGKQADARLLPPVPGGAAPIVPVAKAGALDETTMKGMEEALAQRLGWNNNGGA